MPKKIKTIEAVVKPAVAEETFDEYALTRLVMQRGGNGKITVEAKLAPAKTLQDGSRVVSDSLSGERVVVQDLEAEILSNPTGSLAVAYDAVVDAIVSLVTNAQAQ